MALNRQKFFPEPGTIHSLIDYRFRRAGLAPVLAPQTGASGLRLIGLRAKLAPRTMSERSSVETRTVHAIRIQLHCMADRSVIIWLKDTRKLCVHLMNPRRTWTTARAGDAVMLTHNGTKSREHIESVELYRVFPTEHNGQVVESAWTWIDSGAVMLGQPEVRCAP